MKKILISILLFSFIASCSDKEEGPSCPEGYFGEDCDLPINSVFTGTWDADQLCSTSGAENFNLTFVPSAEDPFEVVIIGMWGESAEAIDVMIDDNNRRRFYQGTQPLGSSGFTIEVTEGTINKAGDRIEIEYIIYSGLTQVESCTVSCVPLNQF